MPSRNPLPASSPGPDAARQRAALLARVAARYRSCGRFAAGYVAGKLRHDPLTGALLALGAAEGFGTVADLGCGRGQFAALLLEAGLAAGVTGLEASPALLAQAQRALTGLAFVARQQDLVADPGVPEADTVLILDMLYQLPTEAQAVLLDAAARAARRGVLVRTADPARGWRARFSRGLEVAARRVWPHSGALVNPQPVEWVAERLRAAGLHVAVAPCWAGTPFGNVLLSARRLPASA
jgi:SAM-dependent methyltransferase